eukprot:7838130-Pyramimonas_sp.AAC.1
MAVCRQGIYLEYSVDFSKCCALIGSHQAPESTAKKAFDVNSTVYSRRPSTPVRVFCTLRPFGARRFECSTEHSMCIPCRQTATWLADGGLQGLLREGAFFAGDGGERRALHQRHHRAGAGAGTYPRFPHPIGPS